MVCSMQNAVCSIGVMHQATLVAFIIFNVCRKIHYSALFINLVGRHASAVSFPISDVILAQLAYPLSDVMFC